MNFGYRQNVLATYAKRLETSRTYKKEVKRQFQKYQADLARKIRGLKSSDPKAYWKIVNGTKSEKEDTNSRISCQIFFEHFKSLNVNDAASNEDVNNVRNDNNDENDLLNRHISDEEVLKAICKLKNNKACGHDQITNEFLKVSKGKMIHIFTKLFNLILLSGKTPEDWAIGMIKPIFKKKGSADDPGNYRGITILSCFGKLFTSVVNNRLIEFFDKQSVVGPEQAGFRSGYSTMDHLFTLHCIIDLFLSKKKRLYCLFVDYEKAFDYVNRAFLWQKLLKAGVKGRILEVIQYMYEKAKSCVKVGDECSEFFQCGSGVRQGENLSPILFAIYLNDLQSYLSEKVEGLTSLSNEAKELGWNNIDEAVMLKMFILLYADDTVICTESIEELQKALDAMSSYCDKWDLRINATKTKVLVFSRGKIKKIPCLKYRDKNIDVVFGFEYLGQYFNYNNRFNVSQKHQYDKASRAMFSLLKKSKKLMLPLDVQIELFDRLITPILLYGCEVWCPSMTDLASKLQLRFYKIILKLRRTTPTRMVYGETGQFPMEVQAKSRMLSFWFNLVNVCNKNKLSSVMYKFLHETYSKHDGYKAPYLQYIESTLNELGLSGMWLCQFELTVSNEWFKCKVKQGLRDQYIQQWILDVDTRDVFYNYRLYKTVFRYEKYLDTLPLNVRYHLIRFRTLNHKLPIQKGRIDNVPHNERLCTKCNLQDIGDEFHYTLICPFFTEKRKHFISQRFWKNPNVMKFHNLFNGNRRTLIKLAHFVKFVMTEF